MPAVSTIDAILARITHPELLYVRQMLKGQELRDFDRLWRTKIANSTRVPKKREGKQRSAEHSRLGKRVAELVADHHLRTQPGGMAAHLRAEANVLYRAGKPTAAIKLLRQALDTALEAEETAIAYDVCATLQSIASELGVNAQVPDSVLDACVRDMQDMAQQSVLMREVKALRVRKDAQRDVEAAAMLTRLEAIPAPVSVKARLYWLWSRMACLVILRRPADFLPVSLDALAVVKERPKVLFDPQCWDFYNTHALAASGAHAALQEFGKAKAVLDGVFAQIAGLQWRNSQRLEYWVRHIEIFEASAEMNFVLVGQLADAALVDFNNWLDASADRKADFCVMVASHLVLPGSKAVFKWLEKTYALRSQVTNSLKLVANAFIEMAALALTGDHELLNLRCEAAQYLLKSKQLYAGPFRAVVLAFEQIAREKTSLKDGLLRLETELSKHSDDYQFRIVLEIFNLLGWIKRVCS